MYMEKPLVMSVHIFNNALNNNDGDHLKAAKGLVETLKLYPDARHDDSMEALDSLLREALLARGA